MKLTKEEMCCIEDPLTAIHYVTAEAKEIAERAATEAATEDEARNSAKAEVINSLELIAKEAETMAANLEAGDYFEKDIEFML